MWKKINIDFKIPSQKIEYYELNSFNAIVYIYTQEYCIQKDFIFYICYVYK